MNSQQWVDYAWVRPQFPQVADAVADGYVHTFVQESNGRYRCLSQPDRYYTKDELFIQEIPCNGVTLCLIQVKDFSYRGTCYCYTTSNY
jgi:hypothetical protein